MNEVIDAAAQLAKALIELLTDEPSNPTDHED